MTAPPGSTGVPSISDISGGFRETAMGEPAPFIANAVPEKAEPLVSVLTAFCIGTAGAFLATSAPLWWTNLITYIRNFLGNFGIGRAAMKESSYRRITARARQPVAAGISLLEVLVTTAGAVLYALAFIVAKKEVFSPGVFIMFVVTAGVAITIHEVGHRYIARKYKDEVEMQLWDLGIITMFVTGYLTGVVFAKPARNIVMNAPSLSKEQMGRIMLAGPVISVAAAAVFVPFLFLGGAYQKAATMSIMFNLLVATYHMMPFAPMDGRAVLRWSSLAWIAVFVPMMIVYLLMFL
jgi:Zn-dependent protease